MVINLNPQQPPVHKAAAPATPKKQFINTTFTVTLLAAALNNAENGAEFRGCRLRLGSGATSTEVPMDLNGRTTPTT